MLDFAATGHEGLVKSAAGLSLTHLLRTFEQGIFALPMVLGSLFAASGCIAVAGIWLHPGRSTIAKLKWTATVVIASAVAIAAASQLHVFRDATENRRNSFSASDEAALRRLPDPYGSTFISPPKIPGSTILNKASSANSVARCRTSRLSSRETARGSVFSGSGDDDYGKIFYFYGTRQAMSRSTSEDEVLPLIFGLAGVGPSHAARTQPIIPGIRTSRIPARRRSSSISCCLLLCSFRGVWRAAPCEFWEGQPTDRTDVREKVVKLSRRHRRD